MFIPNSTTLMSNVNANIIYFLKMNKMEFNKTAAPTPIRLLSKAAGIEVINNILTNFLFIIFPK